MHHTFFFFIIPAILFLPQLQITSVNYSLKTVSSECFQTKPFLLKKFKILFILIAFLYHNRNLMQYFAIYSYKKFNDIIL